MTRLSQTVLITGAAGLVGRGLMRGFGDAGASLLLTEADDEHLARALEHARESGFTARGVVADLAEDHGLEVLIDAAREAGVDVVINNAAYSPPKGPFLRADMADLDRVLRTNLRAPVLLAQGIAQDWAARGVGGAIISLGSPGATRAHDDQAFYDLAKGGLESFTRAAAVELGPYGIRVLGIAPAAVGNPPALRPEAPLGRGTDPREIAALAVFLCSETAASMTGQMIAVDGGILARLRPRAKGAGE